MKCSNCFLTRMQESLNGNSSYNQYNSYMSPLNLENGMDADFSLIPNDQGMGNRLSSTYGSDGKMKVKAYVCTGCNAVSFERKW